MGKNPPSGKPSHGIYRKTRVTGAPSTDAEQRVAEFSYQNDALADLIVKAWTDTTLYNNLTDQGTTEDTRSKAAKKELDARGIHMVRPLVITEAEYYEMESSLSCRTPTARTRRNPFSRSPSC
jgi:hypothetical protein